MLAVMRIYKESNKENLKASWKLVGSVNDDRQIAKL